jgi:hypothetical protein
MTVGHAKVCATLCPNTPRMWFSDNGYKCVLGGECELGLSRCQRSKTSCLKCRTRMHEFRSPLPGIRSYDTPPPPKERDRNIALYGAHTWLPGSHVGARPSWQSPPPPLANCCPGAVDMFARLLGSAGAQRLAHHLQDEMSSSLLECSRLHADISELTAEML